MLIKPLPVFNKRLILYDCCWFLALFNNKYDGKLYVPFPRQNVNSNKDSISSCYLLISVV